MSVYDIDYSVLVKILVPKQLRKTKMLAWLNVLVSPVVYIYNLFMAYRYDMNYIIAHSPQVCYMQAVLNDAFDTGLRRISIVDGPDEEPLYIYETAEVKEVPLYVTSEAKPIALYTDAEIVGVGPDFEVQVPTIVTTLTGYNEVYMAALLDQFKLAGKTYIIKHT